MSGMKVAGVNNVAMTAAISVVATIEQSVLCTREISNVGPHKAHCLDLLEARVKTMQTLPYIQRQAVRSEEIRCVGFTCVRLKRRCGCS